MANPISQAIRRGRISEALRLAKNGVALNEPDENGWTPLFYAASISNKNLVESLLGLGADPNVRDRWDLTAAQHAELDGDMEVGATLRSA